MGVGGGGGVGEGGTQFWGEGGTQFWGEGGDPILHMPILEKNMGWKWARHLHLY